MTESRLRAVLDINVPIAAHLSKNPHSPTVELIERWRRGEFIQLYSDDTVAELHQKLAEKGISNQVIEEYISDLVKFSIHVEVMPEDVIPLIPADPDDDLIVACGMVGGATHIVTYDPHFDILGGEHKGIRIVDGLTFLRRIREAKQTEVEASDEKEEDNPVTGTEALVETEYRKRAIMALRLPVHYPESDGMPMAETDVHINTMIYLLEALRDHFRDDPQVYVGGNLFLYYVERDPAQVVTPDVFVVFGVPKGDRRTYKVWEEGKGPDAVFEVTSDSTRAEDLGPKKGTYEMLGVREYFIFDPLEEYLEPQILGFRLKDGGYRRMEERPLVSQVLGLALRVEGRGLRLYDLETGEKLLAPLEAQAARREEAEARRRAEAEVERLRAELARLRGE